MTRQRRSLFAALVVIFGASSCAADRDSFVSDTSLAEQALGVPVFAEPLDEFVVSFPAGACAAIADSEGEFLVSKAWCDTVDRPLPGRIELAFLGTDIDGTLWFYSTLPTAVLVSTTESLAGVKGPLLALFLDAGQSAQVGISGGPILCTVRLDIDMTVNVECPTNTDIYDLAQLP